MCDFGAVIQVIEQNLEQNLEQRNAISHEKKASSPQVLRSSKRLGNINLNSQIFKLKSQQHEAIVKRIAEIKSIPSD